MLRQIERSRFIVWFSLITMLLLAFVLAWQKVDREASDTALLVASKRILEQANVYKQQWLLKKQPGQILINQKFIKYSANGWVTPLNSANKVDCKYWLDTFYQQERVLESLPIKFEDSSIGSDFQCEYTYSRGQAINISLIDGKFRVGVIFSSEHKN